MLYLAILAAATGFGVAIAAFGSALGLGRTVGSTVEAIARQPEAAGNIRTALLIGGGLIEALTIYALLISILLWTKIPAVEQVIDKLK